MKSTIKLLVIISVINLVIVAAVAKMATVPSPTTLTPSPSEMPMNSPVTNTLMPTPTTTNPISTLTPTPTPTPVADNRCLITIDGARYDVTQFRNTHSGGDIFNCGADMSSDFWGQHGQKELKKMQPYRI